MRRSAGGGLVDAEARSWDAVLLVRWLDQIGPDDEPVVGGKAVSLATLHALGLQVPAAFAIPVDAYRRCRDHAGLAGALESCLVDLDPHDMDDVSARAAAARASVTGMAIDADVSDAVALAYAHLCERAGMADVPVAVRSSARGEDSADASFAGEHDTFLWVRGAEDVLAAVRRCWASLFTDRAVCYRAEVGQAHSEAAMGVVVQHMVLPVAAGVAFTLDPANGDRSVIAIDSSWGLGEGVVSGEVTPDCFRVDKVMGLVTRRVVSYKAHEFQLEGERVVKVAVDPVRAELPSLTDEQVLEVARVARMVERHHGCPQDVEWAVLDASATEVTVLQSRPETVWSRSTTRHGVGESPDDYMSGIVSTLMTPLHIREPE